jgi:hypothetical protein
VFNGAALESNYHLTKNSEKRKYSNCIEAKFDFGSMSHTSFIAMASEINSTKKGPKSVNVQILNVLIKYFIQF